MTDTNFDEIIKKIESMSVLELSQLVKALEERFGVSAVMMSAPAAAVTSSSGDSDAAEKDTFDVILKEGGQSKIQVIKVVREVTGLGLKEAKDLVDGAPKAVKQGLKKDEAEALKQQLETAGASVELK